MSVDIVEIALDNMTDHRQFEKLASEVMRDEGYPNIKPLGGVADSGQDAVQESFFLSEGRNRIVFQYTLQEYLAGKIDDTIKKLDKASCEYNELVIVTSRSISAARQNQMKQDSRRMYGISLNIYERQTLANRLADFENGIFYRHFPDIERQVKGLVVRKPFMQAETGSLVESSMLRASIAFTFDERAPHVRRSIFDYLTLALLQGQQPMTQSELAVEHQKTSGGQRPPDSQIQASLERLISKGLLVKTGGQVTLSTLATEILASNTIKSNEATKSLIGDIIEEICRISGKRLSAQECQIVSQNTRGVLARLFQLFGIEISGQILGDKVPSAVYLDSSEELVSTARRHLTAEMGELLISVISDVLKNPTEEQAKTLANWSLAYLGVEIMSLDPTLRELQSIRIANRIFMLDTDFILDCIVKECPWSSVNMNLVRALRSVGCRVIIPQSCIAECVTHAKISSRTYNYFGPRLLALSNSFVDVQVGNVFVQGYYYGRLKGSILPSVTFEEYLKNYSEPTDAVPFLAEVVKSTFPTGVEFTDPSKLLEAGIPEQLISTLAIELAQIISTSRKAEYRSPENVDQLARTDSELFLTAHQLSEQADKSNGRFLGSCCYLITASGRYRRGARKIGLRDTVTTRPQTLMALLELVGHIELSPAQYVSLFENPLLIYAVTQSWPDVETLLDTGIMLRDKSIARLRWDLSHELHNQIVRVEQVEQSIDIEDETADTSKAEQEYISLWRTTASHGYRRIPELEVLMRFLEKAEEGVRLKEKEYTAKLESYEELEKAIAQFSKRKQKYLRRLAGKIKKT